MRLKVQAGVHPWIDSWNILINNSAAQAGYSPHPQSQIVRGGSGTQTYQYAMWDAAAAYQLSLRWQITGDSSYANTATNILNQWANTCTNVTGDSNYALAAGLYGYEFACAAENLRAYTNWNVADCEKFQSFMTNVFYSANHYFLTYHNGTCATHYWANWDLCNMDSMLAIGVLCDRRDIYNEAIEYYTNGVGAGAANQVMPFSFPGYLGQCQESGRDQGHCTLDPVLLSVFCEIAWNQGDDMYGYDNNELLQLSEYVCKYNVQPLDNSVPFVCYMNCEYYNWTFEYGGVTAVIASGSRGTGRAGWALIYNHYVNRRGLSAPWTGWMAGEVSPEGGGGDYGSTSGGYDELGFTTLTHTLDPIAPGQVPAPGNLIAQPRNNTVTLSWFGSAGATRYHIKRASLLVGPYTNIASVSAPASFYTDVGLMQGVTYYYAVSAMVDGRETTNSTPVSVAPNWQLSGEIIGSPGSYSSAGATKTNLFDGSLNNFYDAYDVSGDWGGLDLGRSNLITQVAYCPRPFFAGRMVGGQFQGANVPDFSSGVVTLFTISNAPADTSPPSLTYQPIGNTNAFRYVRYLGPANGSCNAAEIEFFGMPPAPEPPAAPLDLQIVPGNGQATLTWSESDDTTGYNVKRSASSGGPYAVIATNVITTMFADSGLSNLTNYFYVVSAVNAAGESADSAEAAVTPSAGSRAGSLVWTGGTNAAWDTVSADWTTNFAPTTYQNGRPVLFDDTAWANSVNLPASVSPSAVTFNNFTKGYTFSGSAIAGSCGLTLLGNSWVLLSGANTFTGGVTVQAGNVTVGNANALGTGALTLSGGMLNNSATVNLPNKIIVSGDGAIQLGSANNLTLNGTIVGSGSLTLGNDGNNTSLYLAGANTMSGGTINVANGNNYVRFASAVAGNGNVDWVFNNTAGRTTFDFASGTILFGSMSGDGSIQGNVNGGNSQNVIIQAGGDNNSTTFSGMIHDNKWGTGPIGLTKVGAGTLWLAGADDYSGATTVNNGELVVSSAFAGRGNGSVANGATLGVTNSAAGSGTVSSLTLAGGSTLELMNVASATTPLLAASGNVVVNGSCTVKISDTNGLVAGDTYPLVGYAGTFGGAFTNLQLQMPYGWRGTLATNGNQVVLANVAVVSTVPPALSFANNGAQLQLSWPVANTGWRLQAQTNSSDAGLGNHWTDIPATSTNQVTIPVGSTNQCVFFRLIYP